MVMASRQEATIPTSNHTQAP